MVNEEHGADAADFVVVAGHPAPEEIAALAAALTVKRAAAARQAASARPPASAWADRRHLMRSPLETGPSGWRRSALPR
jgi:hypothetical protein